MKPVKLLALCLALLFCLPFLLVSCGERSGLPTPETQSTATETTENVSEPPSGSGINTVKQVELKGEIVAESRSTLVFRDGQTYTAYNVDLDRIVYQQTFDDPSVTVTFKFNQLKRMPYFYVRCEKTDAAGNKTHRVTLYTENGDELAASDRDEMPKHNYSFLFFADRAFREVYTKNGGTIQELANYEPIIGTGEPIYAMGSEYYYSFLRGSQIVIENNVVQNYVRVYDGNLKPVCSYVPSPVPDSMSGPTLMRNGNFLVQLFTILPDDAQDYTIFLKSGLGEIPAGKKLKHRTVLVDIKTGQETELDFPYVIRRSDFYSENRWASEYADLYLNLEHFETVLTVSPLEDRLYRDSLNNILLSVDDSGKILGRADRIYEFQKDGSFCFRAAENRYTVPQANDQIALVDETGKPIVEGLSSTHVMFKDGYFMSSGKIYDYDGKLLLDLQTVSQERLYFGDNTLLIGKPSRQDPETFVYELWKDGELTELDNGYTGTGEDSVFVRGLYALKKHNPEKNDQPEIKLYDPDSGELLATLAGEQLKPRSFGIGAMLYQLLSADGEVLGYWRVRFSSFAA